MKLICSLLFASSCLLLAAGNPPKPTGLCRSGEGILFSFNTKSGKTATLCRGPKGAYLVYRFGTDAKVELQYPAKLDASSWQKFTYWSYTRGGGAANEGIESTQLRFENGGVAYTLTDETRAYYTKQHEEDYRREVGIDINLKGKTISVNGVAPTAVGDLANVQNDHKVKVDEEM